METTSSTPSRNQNRRFPPQRGQIKTQIFERFTSTVVSLASKAGEALSRIKEGGTSAPTSPPPSSYSSDGQVEGETRIGVFAARSIKAGEPLTYDYRFVQFGPEVKCQCGAPNCQAYLGAKRKITKVGLCCWGSKRKRTSTVIQL